MLGLLAKLGWFFGVKLPAWFLFNLFFDWPW